ncbi:hypothetical protein OROMI_012744 [Orobanche minor]
MAMETKFPHSLLHSPHSPPPPLISTLHSCRRSPLTHGFPPTAARNPKRKLEPKPLQTQELPLKPRIPRIPITIFTHRLLRRNPRTSHQKLPNLLPPPSHRNPRRRHRSPNGAAALRQPRLLQLQLLRQAYAAVAAAANLWSSMSQFKFVYSNNYDATDIKISFQYMDHGDGSNFDDSGGRWVNGVEGGAFDIQTMGLHELGHVLGLGHSASGDSIMWSYIGNGFRKGLNNDNVAGIKALYS